MGLAWIREYTLELLPWFELLPQSTNHLPITWNRTQRDEVLLAGTDALEEVLTLEREFEPVRPYIEMLGLTEEQVDRVFLSLHSLQSIHLIIPTFSIEGALRIRSRLVSSVWNEFGTDWRSSI